MNKSNVYFGCKSKITIIISLGRCVFKILSTTGLHINLKAFAHFFQSMLLISGKRANSSFFGRNVSLTRRHVNSCLKTKFECLRLHLNTWPCQFNPSCSLCTFPHHIVYQKPLNNDLKNFYRRSTFFQ